MPCANCKFFKTEIYPHEFVEAEKSAHPEWPKDVSRAWIEKQQKGKCHLYPVSVDVTAGHWCGQFISQNGMGDNNYWYGRDPSWNEIISQRNIEKFKKSLAYIERLKKRIDTMKKREEALKNASAGPQRRA